MELIHKVFIFDSWDCRTRIRLVLVKLAISKKKYYFVYLLHKLLFRMIIEMYILKRIYVSSLYTYCEFRSYCYF